LFALENKQYEEQIKPLSEQLQMLEENPPRIDEKDKYLVWENAINEVKESIEAIKIS
jgi:hypothetical protein